VAVVPGRVKLRRQLGGLVHVVGAAASMAASSPIAERPPSAEVEVADALVQAPKPSAETKVRTGIRTSPVWPGGDPRQPGAVHRERGGD